MFAHVCESSCMCHMFLRDTGNVGNPALMQQPVRRKKEKKSPHIGGTVEKVISSHKHSGNSIVPKWEIIV